MSALTLKGVKKSYDGKQNVLHGINADVEDGEFVVMVGPSGCGKSTLLRMVAGLEAITEGEIAIDGKVVNNLEPKDRNIAMVFQNYALYPHMTVAENMGYALKIAGLPKTKIESRVMTAAKILELEPLLSRKPRELSGGQRQRVAMGRAIVREPAVFLFDEPLSNLDARLRVQMRLEIQRLHGRLRTTSLYVTHDQIEAMTLAQRVIVMNRGHAEQIGAPTEVYERPATTFVAGFIGSPGMNLLNGWITEDAAFFEVAGEGPRLPLAGVPCVGREVTGGRACVLGIRPEHMTPSSDAGAATAALAVDSCELLGADNLAHGRWGKHDVTVRLPHGHRPQAGERLQVALPGRHVHFFDEENGRRLN
ncbi:sn-glycerol-3-phosphate import ATP-binding protein UgpC [Paraburkholderia caribensis]|uniref:Glycerol-3-phosphate ABC transporter ATP-binding protein n=1 Tax=Paraburkholderia caribensis TaxID=75105 RepID=A0A9Q6S136_9BURK|nr:sn-glycerol-3-phosphate import ATP-binding protein UgpC [Paraburkholderia caribensis]MCO4881936.1 sn-glycerol-3-phosphate import ATP-binding protein UgpC [Paraburkholderia caribensis]PTB25390.1 sn-glycerol-3-phosphate ABC transporter ATP-binding protein UgpC [Paraburkholderia caribensis]QLB62877.1 glycerol-3-phosphate ABC transporter ATP-binding protein [Paraburkholderia caribensis]